MQWKSPSQTRRKELDSFGRDSRKKCHIQSISQYEQKAQIFKQKRGDQMAILLILLILLGALYQFSIYMHR